MGSDTAVVSPSWNLGDPPVPGAIPGFYLDGAEFWLHWVDSEEAHNQEGLPIGYLPVEVDGKSIDIPWPFIGDYATREDFLSLGFVDTVS